MPAPWLVTRPPTQIRNKVEIAVKTAKTVKAGLWVDLTTRWQVYKAEPLRLESRSG
jgi:hypothetical protein